MAQLPLLVAWRAFNFGMSESAAERKAKKIREEREDKRRSKKRRKEQRKAYNRKHCKAVAIYMPLGPKFILVRHGTVPKALLFSRDGSHINFGLKFLNASLCAGSRFRGGSCWRLWRFGGGLCTYQQDTVGV